MRLSDATLEVTLNKRKGREENGERKLSLSLFNYTLIHLIRIHNAQGTYLPIKYLGEELICRLKERLVTCTRSIEGRKLTRFFATTKITFHIYIHLTRLPFLSI